MLPEGFSHGHQGEILPPQPDVDLSGWASYPALMPESCPSGPCCPWREVTCVQSSLLSGGQPCSHSHHGVTPWFRKKNPKHSGQSASLSGTIHQGHQYQNNWSNGPWRCLIGNPRELYRNLSSSLFKLNNHTLILALHNLITEWFFW